eukprot:261152-Chlamydomonas_euryale.AAC.2
MSRKGGHGKRGRGRVGKGRGVEGKGGQGKERATACRGRVGKGRGVEQVEEGWAREGACYGVLHSLNKLQQWRQARKGSG